MILDTCALLWLAAGGKQLSAATLKKIQEAPGVFVSPISGFEIGMKVAKGKLKLPLPPGEWMEKVLERHGLTVAPLDVPICTRAAGLPPIHDDPCDRLIIATALSYHWDAITKDSRFGEYGLTVWG